LGSASTDNVPAFGAWRRPWPGRLGATTCRVISKLQPGCWRCDLAQDTRARVMSQNGTIRVGIISAGNIAGHHITGYLQAAEHAQVTAIADVDAERARHHTERLDDPDIFLDYRDMVASPNVDAVDICLPHHLHKDAIVAAAAAGKHILCEKPLCLTLEEAAAVTGAVATAGAVLPSIVTGWADEPASCSERFSFVGEQGSVWSDGRRLHYMPRGGEEVTVQDAVAQAPDTYALEVVDFIDCLRQRRLPLNTEVEGVNVLKVILGAYASAERGTVVELKNL